MDTDERASILAFAKLHGLAKASEQFNVSQRTIGRWRAAIQNGKAPALAKLVEEQANAAAARRADLIALTLDDGLSELRRRFKDQKMSDADLIVAIEKVGKLRLTRDFLGGGDDDEPRADSRAAGDEGSSGEGPGANGATTGSEGAPLQN